MFVFSSTMPIFFHQDPLKIIVPEFPLGVKNEFHNSNVGSLKICTT